MATKLGRSRRTKGSPPVRRTERTPREASTRTTRSISSKRRISARSSHGSPSAGMQYWQRKLQRSVTDRRRSPISRPCPSVSWPRSIRDERTLRAVHLRALTALTLVCAAALGACGRDSGEEEVRATLQTFADATARKDYQRLCDELFSKELVEEVDRQY